ncbi:MAG: adenylate kinase family protein [Methanomassiliicoccales archaeon]
MVIAITGTPGTGKTSVASLLRARGYDIIEIDQIVRSAGLISGYDEERGSAEIDIDGLSEAVRSAISNKGTILVGHLAHLIDPSLLELIIILRCKPSILEKRLRNLGWKEEKILENVEAEACDVILIESLEQSDSVFEIDTSTKTPDEVATCVLEILAGEREKYAYGNIDWSEEVLNWF